MNITFCGNRVVELHLIRIRWSCIDRSKVCDTYIMLYIVTLYRLLSNKSRSKGGGESVTPPSPGKFKIVKFPIWYKPLDRPPLKKIFNQCMSKNFFLLELTNLLKIHIFFSFKLVNIDKLMSTNIEETIVYIFLLLCI